MKKYFTLRNIESQAGDEASQNIKWVDATPKEEGAGFSKVILGLSDNKLSVMKIVDAFEHTTTISFKNAKYNISLTDNDFLFKLPDGVDVVQSGAIPDPTNSSSNIKNKTKNVDVK